MGTRGKPGDGRATLVYDSECPVCSATVAWIRKNARGDAFEMFACQAESLERRFPDIPRVACMRAMQLVLPDGTVLSGEKALPEVLARLHRYRRMGAIFRFPGFPAASRVLYRWFADHRYGIAKLLKRFPRTEQAKDRTWQRKTS